MYRLPNGGSGNALQKAISRELINAFTVVFGVTISENDISLDWARLMDFLEENQLRKTPMVSDEMWELRIIGMLRELSDPSCQLLTTEVASLMILVIQSPIQTTRVYRSLSGPNVIPCGMLPEMPGSYPWFRRYRFYGRLQGTLT